MSRIATSLKTRYGEKYRGAWHQRSRVDPQYDEESTNAMWESIAVVVNPSTSELEDSRDPMNLIRTMAEHDDPIGYRMYGSKLPRA